MASYAPSQASRGFGGKQPPAYSSIASPKVRPRFLDLTPRQTAPSDKHLYAAFIIISSYLDAPAIRDVWLKSLGPGNSLCRIRIRPCRRGRYRRALH